MASRSGNYYTITLAAASICVVGVLALKLRGVLTIPIQAVPARLDIGRVAEGSTISSTTMITNTTSKGAVIERIGASCGCTTTNNITYIAPGASVPLVVTFDSHGKAGDVSKTVSIFVAGHASTPVQVTMVGKCVQELRSEPEVLLLGNVYVKQSVSKSFMLTRSDGKPLEIEGIEMPPSVTTFTTRVSDRQARVTVTTTAPDLPGSYEDAINIRVNHPSVKTVRVPIQYEVVGAYTLQPEQLNWGTPYVGKSAQLSVRVHGVGVKRLRVISLPKGMTGSLCYTSDADCVLAIQYTPKGGKGNIIKSRVVLDTGNPKQRMISIPTYAALQ